MHLSNDKETKAIAFLEKKPIHMLALESSLSCNLTFYPLLLWRCEKQGLSTFHRTLRNALASLAKPAGEFAPLLRGLSMRVQGRSGSATTVYTLTDFGRRVMSRKGFRTPEAQDEAGMAHRYIQLEVYLHTLKSGAEVQVETVLPYDGGRRNIRVDVLATFTRELGIPGHVEEDQYLFEAEQELLPSNAKRALEKVRNWQDYGLPGEYPNIVIVFNVPTKKFEQTLNIWREALQSTEEELTFQVRCISLKHLLELPLQDAVREYSVDLDPDQGERETAVEDLSPFARQVREYQPDEELLQLFEDRVVQFREAYTHSERIETFFDMMRCIHQASDLSENGDIFRYNQLPVESLGLLYRYLTLEENQPLYDDLRQAIHWVQGRGSLGVTLLREVNTQILWEVFLAHHGLARGGKLQVSYEIADHLEKFTNFGVAVLYHGSNYAGSKDTHPDDAALAWVLTALFIYAEPLGLGRLPWKKKPKGGDA